ncbi:MAG: branched-chain amino acid ABC transporter permease [Alphaproteobacteria bacterium]|nr:branched-chain amino acid ABC transporter permease [Alphaproteobacteria bacterium]
MAYGLHLMMMICIYLVLVYSMNLITGFGGLMSMGHAAFYGIGAYAYALLAMHFNLGFSACCLLAIVFSGLIGWILSKATLKFRGETFVLTTLGFQMIIFSILDNWESVTKGSYGIQEIPKPEFFGFYFTKMEQFTILGIIAALLITYIVGILGKSPFGLSLKAIRDNEKAAETLCISPQKQLTRAFVISAALAGFAGCLFASYVTYIDPTSFSLSESMFIMCILFVGGSGNLLGPFLGVIFMILFPEGLRFLGFPDEIAANIREIVYGTILIVLMYYRPNGLKGSYTVK